MALPYFERQLTFGGWLGQGILYPNHRLFRLAEIIDWEAMHAELAPFYSQLGRRPLPIRLMVGLHLLKHLESLSDEQCTDRVRGDLYWMRFCGVSTEALQGRYAHLNSSSMTKFRNRIGAKGFQAIEELIRKYLLETRHIDPRVMTVDSTCMEKNVEYPTDSGLLDKGRRKLIAGMKKLKEWGVKPVAGIRSFKRRARQIVVLISKLGRDRPERIKSGTLELARQAVHVANKCQAMLKRARNKMRAGGEALRQQVRHLSRLESVVRRVIHQSRQRFKGHHVPRKVYSLHEPHVLVIRKGKRSKKNEYGTKVNLSIDRHGFIVTHEIHSTIAGKGDASLLSPAISHWRKTTGRLPDQVNADRGYHQSQLGRIPKQVARLCIPTQGRRKHPDHDKRWFRRGQARRAVVEAVIGNLKQHHGLGKSRYAGFAGDRINLSLGCTAWNLSKLARCLA
jgi:transposase, IS5 family